MGQTHAYIMSKKRRPNRKGTKDPRTTTAKAFAEAMSRYSQGYTLSFAVEILRDNGFPADMTEAYLLDFLRDCGWVQADGRPSAQALEKGMLQEDLSTEVREHGRRIARYSFRLSGTGFAAVITALLEVRKEAEL